MGSFVVGALVVAVVGLAAASVLRQRKVGGCSGCSGCDQASACHRR